MISSVLEFRGIHTNHLKEYFEELGAKHIEDHDPIQYKGEQWSVEILKEDEISFTSSFKVNTVHLRFTAENEQELQELIRKFRYKTTRVGG